MFFNMGCVEAVLILSSRRLNKGILVDSLSARRQVKTKRSVQLSILLRNAFLIMVVLSTGTVDLR